MKYKNVKYAKIEDNSSSTANQNQDMDRMKRLFSGSYSNMDGGTATASVVGGAMSVAIDSNSEGGKTVYQRYQV